MLFEVPESKDQPEFHGDHSMSSRQIDEFAKILVQEVRDAAIRECDIAQKPECQAITAKRWRRLGAADAVPLMKTVIPDCIDEALFFLLHAIDQGILRLQFVTADGEVVDLSRDGKGEMAGWYAGGSEGWLAMYSKERFSDIANPEDEASEPQAK